VGWGSVADEEAVADVFAMEDWAMPGRPGSIPDQLLRHPRTLFTPHLGSAAGDVRRQMSLPEARHVQQVLEGRRPGHAVKMPRL
jgi:phosphonate dehydrogenase